MKKVRWFNWWTQNFGGTYIEVRENDVIHSHFYWFFTKWRFKLVLTHTETFKKDGKVIVENFYSEKDENGNEKSDVWKYNYLEYFYEFKKFPKIKIIK